MRWRQVIVLWVVCGALAADYFLVERRAEPPAPEHPARAPFLALRAQDLREIHLARGGRVVVTVRRDDHWEVVQPVDAFVPPDLIAAFANALTSAEEIDVVEGAAGDGRAYGLDAEAGRVEMVGEHGTRVVVELGGTNPTGTAVYARRDAASRVVLIGRNVRYYEDLIFQSLPASRPPTVDQELPVGG